MDSGRLEAFSDGVFGVAITLLALSLGTYGPGKDRQSLAGQIGAHWPAFAAYVISFATIGIIWVNHHSLFKNFAEIDRVLLFLNLLLLFFVVSIPFATATIAAYLRRGGPDASLAAAIFQGVFVGMALSFAGMFWSAVRKDHMRITFTREAGRQATIRFGLGCVPYVLAMGVAFLSATASLAITGLVAIYYIFEQTPTAEASSDTGPEDR